MKDLDLFRLWEVCNILSNRQDDFSHIPSVLLSFGEKELNEWMEGEIKRQLEQQELEKSAEKERIKQEIEQLTKRLNNL